MHATNFFIVALALLPAIMTAGLTWLAIHRTDRALAGLDGFRGIHFED